MANDQVVTNLTKIIELSDSMLASARAGDWNQVQEIEQQRQEFFVKVFPLDRDSITDPDAIAGLVQKIVELDKETMGLATGGSKEVSDLLDKLSIGRQAVSAYRNVEGG